jgi:FkbM family methyltransferase
MKEQSADHEVEDIYSASKVLAPQRLTRVLDVGANPIDGDPPYKAMLDSRLCEVVGFEPNPQAFERLQRRKGPNEVYLPFAVGDGEAHVLNIYKAAGFSSLLEIRPEIRDLLPSFSRGTELSRQLPVVTQKIDSCDEIPDFDFLKIDIQGGELSVLQNAHRKLSSAIAVQIEVSFLPLYQSQPGFGQIDVELRSLGFLPHTFVALKKWLIAPITKKGRRWDPINQLLEGDLVYFRDYTNPDHMSDEQLRHLAMVAHYCYGSFDVSARCMQILDNRLGAGSGLLHSYVEALPAIFDLPQSTDGIKLRTA